MTRALGIWLVARIWRLNMTKKTLKPTFICHIYRHIYSAKEFTKRGSDSQECIMINNTGWRYELVLCATTRVRYATLAVERVELRYTPPASSLAISSGSDGVVVITSALHADGREFDPRSDLKKILFRSLLMYRSGNDNSPLLFMYYFENYRTTIYSVSEKIRI